MKGLLDLFVREESKLSANQATKDLPSQIVNSPMIHPPPYSTSSRYPFIQGPISRDSRHISSTPGPPHPAVDMLAGHFSRSGDSVGAAATENFYHPSHENMRQLQQDKFHLHSESRLQSVPPDAGFSGSGHGSSTSFSSARESIPTSHAFSDSQLSRSPQRLVLTSETRSSSSVEHGPSAQGRHFGNTLNQNGQETYRSQGLSYSNGMHTPLFGPNRAFGMEANKMSMASPHAHSNPMLEHLPLAGQSASYNQGVVGQPPQFENGSNVEGYSAFGGHNGFGGLGNLALFYGSSEATNQFSVPENAFSKLSTDSVFELTEGGGHEAELARLGIEEFGCS